MLDFRSLQEVRLARMRTFWTSTLIAVKWKLVKMVNTVNMRSRNLSLRTSVGTGIRGVSVYDLRTRRDLASRFWSQSSVLAWMVKDVITKSARCLNIVMSIWLAGLIGNSKHLKIWLLVLVSSQRASTTTMVASSRSKSTDWPDHM